MNFNPEFQATHHANHSNSLIFLRPDTIDHDDNLTFLFLVSRLFSLIFNTVDEI